MTRRPLRLTKYLALLLATILLWSHIAISSGFCADEQVVLRESGNGIRNLRPFTVRDKWEVRWQHSGDYWMADAIRTDPPEDDFLAKLPLPIAAQKGSGPGQSYQHKGGTYCLRVNAVGDWTVTVVQLP